MPDSVYDPPALEPGTLRVIPTGGLGEVSSALPRILQQHYDIRLLIPGYRPVLEAHPDMPIVGHLAKARDIPRCDIGKAVTPEWVRKRLHVAREKFTDLLLDEVARSLEDPAAEDLEQELIDLGLHEYCRAALARRRPA